MKSEKVNVKVVARDAVPAITSIIDHGKTIELGEHRDFRNSSILKSFMDNARRCSLSWVKLTDGEILENHRHPTESMIIVTSGSVYLTGDKQQLANEGDVICINSGALHGFKTIEGQCFRGLSVQFEGLGLYENQNNPRVVFECNGFESLIELNEKHVLYHHQNPLFDLVRKGEFKCISKRKVFLHYLLRWSKAFQKMLHARQATVQSVEFESIYIDHFEEELGHDKLLSEHYDPSLPYDAQLESACNWFVYSMYTLDEVQRLALVHLVVETSGHIFGSYLKNIIKGEQDYFEIHAEADDDHSSIGQEHFKNLTREQYLSLSKTLNEGWKHMDLIHERITDLIGEFSTESSQKIFEPEI
ncbi:cupin domain-containing protein [Vibrio sp. 10N.237.312.B06]|uniref:cupin domain-containing protein n=1 Tax=Vibrio sp. 10N.237.312.B06 TaxID=3229974 RepID=UPI003552FCA7